jgi:dihydrolipoamide dehydrogenase
VEVLPVQGDRIRVETNNILIAWGSEPSTIPGIRISGRIMDSSGFLSMERLPSSAIIVGGGAIGIEFANFLAELGVRVAVIELLDQILPNEDQEAVGFLTAELKKLGIEINTSTGVTSLDETGDGVRLKGKKGEEIIELLGECALICTGRKPSFCKEDLDRTGIAYSARGITVSDCQQTSVKNIFALGDVTGGMLLAHRASAQGKALARYLFGDGGFYYREEWVPGVVYTHPSLARVGPTEKQARDQGLDIEIRKVEYSANITARTELRGNGFLKALFVKERLIGVTIVGDEAGELIAAMGLAIANGMGKEELRRWVLPHPSLSELLAGF